MASKSRLPGLSCGVVCVILSLAVLVELLLVIDRHRQTQTDPGPLLVPRVASRGKNEKRKVSGPGWTDGARFYVPLDTK